MARQRRPHHRWHSDRRARTAFRESALLHNAHLPIRRCGRLLRGLAGRDLSPPVGQSTLLPTGIADLGEIRSTESRQLPRRFRALDGVETVKQVLSSQLKSSSPQVLEPHRVIVSLTLSVSEQPTGRSSNQYKGAELAIPGNLAAARKNSGTLLPTENWKLLF